jgi:hypothetical protein
MRAFCEFVAESDRSPVTQYTPSGADIDSVIDLRAVFQQAHQELDIETAPAILLPGKGRYRLRDYEKVYCPDLKSGQDIFDLRGVDRAGCVVVVRPDQYVAHVLPLDASASFAPSSRALCSHDEPRARGERHYPPRTEPCSPTMGGPHARDNPPLTLSDH